MSWYGGYLTTAHVHFKNTEPKVENDQSSDFDVRIVRAGVPGIFQAHLLENKKQQIGHNLVRTYKIFVTFSLCSSKTN